MWSKEKEESEKEESQVDYQKAVPAVSERLEVEEKLTSWILQIFNADPVYKTSAHCWSEEFCTLQANQVNNIWLAYGSYKNFLT